MLYDVPVTEILKRQKELDEWEPPVAETPPDTTAGTPQYAPPEEQIEFYPRGSLVAVKGTPTEVVTRLLKPFMSLGMSWVSLPGIMRSSWHEGPTTIEFGPDSPHLAALGDRLVSTSIREGR
jgi:hypothetical protein